MAPNDGPKPLTRDEADVVYRMHKHASGLPPLAQRYVARAMVRAARMGQSTRDIELYLAFTPWLDGGRRYADAFLAGAVSAFQHYAGDGMDQEILQATYAAIEGRVNR